MPTIKSSELQVNRPIEAAAPDTLLKITIDPDRVLAIGPYKFQLVAVDNSENKSQPFSFTVVVMDDQAPNAIITGPSRVEFGKEFTLNGAESRDVGGGTIVRYIWMLVGQPG
ncbi:MAG TPA: hypothetical protein VE422_45805 [Terriglobia bacterium]|nr:hypothetical protein [Terriglobia bacterium]